MTITPKKWLIYGANGYTGRLIAERAAQAENRPILAGRNLASIEPLAQELACEGRTFALHSADEIVPHLDDVSLVLNCAGPFKETAEPLIEACLRSGVHYLDITGEWTVIEHAAQQHLRAQSAGCVIMPAVGFDVVPSDCLAVLLANALPTATRLELAFQVATRESSISPGTATTIFSQLGQGTFERIAGRIEQLKSPWQSSTVPFPSGSRTAVAISWGDIASAFHSTGIPNIRVSQAISPKMLARFKRWSWLLPVMGWALVQWLGRRWIKRNIPGPNEKQRSASHAEFWGQATDARGVTAAATLSTPEGYTLTTFTSLEIVRRVLSGEVPPGFSTPGKAFGGEFITQFEGVSLHWISAAEL